MKPRDKMLSLAYAIACLIAMSGLIIIVCSALAPKNAQAASSVIVTDQSEGPLYDLPSGVNSYIATERSTNRAYIVVESDRGIAVTPYLDGDGDQVVIARP